MRGFSMKGIDCEHCRTLELFLWLCIAYFRFKTHFFPESGSGSIFKVWQWAQSILRIEPPPLPPYRVIWWNLKKSRKIVLLGHPVVEKKLHVGNSIWRFFVSECVQPEITNSIHYISTANLFLSGNFSSIANFQNQLTSGTKFNVAAGYVSQFY
jgi:hypothetical protein